MLIIQLQLPKRTENGLKNYDFCVAIGCFDKVRKHEIYFASR